MRESLFTNVGSNRSDGSHPMEFLMNLLISQELTMTRRSVDLPGNSYSRGFDESNSGRASARANEGDRPGSPLLDARGSCPALAKTSLHHKTNVPGSSGNTEVREGRTSIQQTRVRRTPDPGKPRTRNGAIHAARLRTLKCGACQNFTGGTHQRALTARRDATS